MRGIGPPEYLQVKFIPICPPASLPSTLVYDSFCNRSQRWHPLCWICQLPCTVSSTNIFPKCDTVIITTPSRNLALYGYNRREGP